MIRKRFLWRDERGAATIEIAIALPILVLFIYGMFTIGVLFQANAGLQHSLGFTQGGVCNLAHALTDACACWYASRNRKP